MKVNGRTAQGFHSRVWVKMYLLLVDPGKSFWPSPGVRPEGTGAFREGEYVYCVAGGWG